MKNTNGNIAVKGRNRAVHVPPVPPESAPLPAWLAESEPRPSPDTRPEPAVPKQPTAATKQAEPVSAASGVESFRHVDGHIWTVYPTRYGQTFIRDDYQEITT